MLSNDSSSPEQAGKRLKYIRIHLLNFTRNEICANTEVSIPALKAWELGLAGGLTEKGAEKLIPRFRELGIYCSAPWLLHGIGTEATFQTESLQTNAAEDAQIAKELLCFRSQGNTLTAVIKDDGMLPTLPPETLVGGIMINDLQTALEQKCIIVTQDDETFVRILLAAKAAGYYDLECANKQPHLAKKIIKNVKVKAAAPIIWIRRKG
jgi:hypothetical protein